MENFSFEEVDYNELKNSDAEKIKVIVTDSLAEDCDGLVEDVAQSLRDSFATHPGQEDIDFIHYKIVVMCDKDIFGRNEPMYRLKTEINLVKDGMMLPPDKKSPVGIMCGNPYKTIGAEIVAMNLSCDFDKWEKENPQKDESEESSEPAADTSNIKVEI